MIYHYSNNINVYIYILAIHRGIVFYQYPLIASQMESNQKIRKSYQEQKLSSSADAIKRLSNSLFGKFLEVKLINQSTK